MTKERSDKSEFYTQVPWARGTSLSLQEESQGQEGALPIAPRGHVEVRVLPTGTLLVTIEGRVGNTALPTSSATALPIVVGEGCTIFPRTGRYN